MEDNLEDNLEDYKGSIAIVGMSCRLPGANSAEEYWELLAEGKDAIRTFPSDRPSPVKVKTSEAQAGFLKCPIDEFDAKFFEISPREAHLIDPQQRLLLEVTWESLEHAGINPQSLRNSDTGVYVGMWIHEYEKLIVTAENTENESLSNDFLHVFLGNKHSATASRISYFLGLNGPAMAVESGCSSSLSGIHLACESLHTGEISLGIASGVNLILVNPVNPFSGTAEDKDVVFLAKDYKCKTFDETADGFVR